MAVKNKNDKIIENPPIFKTWKRLYIIVFLNLVLLVILFYFFTKVFE